MVTPCTAVTAGSLPSAKPFPTSYNTPDLRHSIHCPEACHLCLLFSATHMTHCKPPFLDAWRDACRIRALLTQRFEAVDPQSSPPHPHSLRPTVKPSNPQIPSFTRRLSPPSHPQLHWPLCPPRVWVGSAVGLVWLAPKINSLADGRRRCAQAPGGGGKADSETRGGEGGCLPAPCKHAHPARPAPLYLPFVGPGAVPCGRLRTRN